MHFRLKNFPTEDALLVDNAVISRGAQVIWCLGLNIRKGLQNRARHTVSTPSVLR